jgi:hypothetical protein
MDETTAKFNLHAMKYDKNKRNSGAKSKVTAKKINRQRSEKKKPRIANKTKNRQRLRKKKKKKKKRKKKS